MALEGIAEPLLSWPASSGKPFVNRYRNYKDFPEPHWHPFVRVPGLTLNK